MLSGGGARGLAHGGVLVGLEQLGYDPPVVVGTSMGAVVGALYATGYTSMEIWDIVALQNWADTFAPDAFPVGPERQPRRPMISVGLAHGPGAALEGFVAQAAINRRLVELLFDAGARANNDFDALPRRFRAIAADLGTGRERVLARGDLARAVRASMAVPGVFAPVRWGDAVLVDGALANNLGISVARQLSDAPVLAVDVLRPITEIEETSALEVGLRAMRLLLRNVRAGLDTAELLVLPRIPPPITEATFPADATPLLRAGLAAAMSQLPRAAGAGAAVGRSPSAPPRTIDALRVEGVSGALAELVERTFRAALGAYEPERVLSRVEALFATGMFHGVWPRLERDASGRGTLVVYAEPIAPAVATGAARWDSDVGAGGWAAFRARTRLVVPLELRAAATLERLNRTGSLSGTLMSGMAAPWAVSLGTHYREQWVRAFDAEHHVIAEPRVRRVGAWLALEWRRLRPQQALSLAFRAEQVDAQQGPSGASYGPYLRFGAFPPTYGLLGLENVVEGELRFGDDHYTRLHAAGSTTHRWRRLQAALVGSFTTTGGDVPVDVLPALGGQLQLPWLRTGDLRGRTAVIGGVDVAYPLVPALDVRLRFRSGAASNDIDALRDARWWSGGEAAVVWRTAIAPITAGIASGAGQEWRLNLSAGATW